MGDAECEAQCRKDPDKLWVLELAWQGLLPGPGACLPPHCCWNSQGPASVLLLPQLGGECYLSAFDLRRRAPAGGFCSVTADWPTGYFLRLRQTRMALKNSGFL